MNLDNKEYKKCYDSLVEWRKTEAKVGSRIKEVLDLMAKLLNLSIVSWGYYKDVGRNHADYGTLAESWADHYVNLYVELSDDLTMMDEWFTDFDLSFLSMSDADIKKAFLEEKAKREKELQDERDAEEQIKKNKAAAKKKRAAVIKTLTKDQKEALGINE